MYGVWNGSNEKAHQDCKGCQRQRCRCRTFVLYQVVTDNCGDKRMRNGLYQSTGLYRVCNVILVILSLILISSQAHAQKRMTTFNPKVHGFLFGNEFTNTRYYSGFRVDFGGRCGGMVYAALDYYYSKTPRPTTTTLPTEGSTLSTFISARQEDSFVPNIDKWVELTVNPLGERTGEFFNWGLQGFGGGRLQELRQSIDAGRPVPINLFHPSDMSKHHQVLAFGYDLRGYTGDLKAGREKLQIFVYDPNYPGEMRTLYPDVQKLRFRYAESKEEWLTYFVDAKYRSKRPLENQQIAGCTGLNWSGQDYSGQNLSGLKGNLRCANLSRTNFRGATITQGDFEKAQIDGTIFYGANLRNSNFTDAHGNRPDFYGADLKTVQFIRSKLQYARFYGADLRNANLANADLTGADLRGANLQGANLTGANLTGANIEGADFRNTQRSGLILTGTKRNGSTQGL